ncbi:MAG: leucine--tRNA ligase [Burkholderiales bacterium]|nr:leucine--tRNA ligase [Burkholderiales bacterium]OJX02459.1 MAG: leucine--tRNA ligase [Burkholderiales bacterium 70-64]
MHEKYDAAAIEAAAQTHWSAIDAYRAVEHDPRFPKGKFYACSMLPYPSGKLHMGHVRNYTINDVMYRHLRMNGYNVLMPMGWDAFGLPAENAAMKNRVAPAKWTWDNIAHMKGQMQAMGLAIDWKREVATCSPEYYKWNQWLFLKMLEHGIAYLRTGTVNWDPVDQTVLANEQVIDGRGWRSGAPVEKREIPMYYLGITRYADELLADLEGLGWPERVKLMQENWIGRSTGVRFAFPHDIRDARGELIGDGRMYVFTTRADTIMGVTFVAVAPEHPIAAAAAAADPALAAFVEACKRGGVTEAELATREKDGRPTGLTVTHPLSGERIEVWVGNYVLMSYGDGAVMGVPAHDERDFAFARKFGLPIRQVIDVEGQPFSTEAWQGWYEDKGRGRCVNSGRYDGLAYEAAVDAIAADLAARGLGEKRVQFRLRDWGISRQRYWGTPIPIIHCEACGAVPVPYAELPVVLPEDLVPDGSGNPLSRHARFLACTCPKCGKPARRETDTMDTFVDSSWYYMRYCSHDNAEAMVDARNDYWMPMDQYIGGIEHAVLHLLYARFWTKVMRDIRGDFPGDAARGLVRFDEPFTNLLCQGMVLNHIYSRRTDKGGIEYFWPDDIDWLHDETGKPVGCRSKTDGLPVDYEGIGTMSKSKNNGVDPQSLIDQYGADTARLFVMFASPPEQTLEWSGAGVEGAQRFLRRLWACAFARHAALRGAPAAVPDPARLEPAHKALRREIHLVLRQADYDYQRKQYNTVVSAAMKMLNAIEGAGLAASPETDAVMREAMSILIRVLYPVVPHVTHALWQALGYAEAHGDLLDAPWPVVDEAALAQDEIELVLQVNGKVRGALKVPAAADRAAIEAAALAHEAFARHAGDRPARKVVVVPGRLVNVVV